MTDAQADPQAPDHYVSQIMDRLGQDGERVVIRWRDQTIARSQLRGAVRRAVAALGELGVSAGATVAVLTEVNSPWMLATRYAIHAVGATLVYISGANHGTTTHALSADTRARMMRETGARVLMYDEASADGAESLRRALAGDVAGCVLGAPLSGSVSVNGRTVDESSRPLIPRAPQSGLVIYTSGSTGRPKGVSKPFCAWNDLVLRESAGSGPKTFLALSAVSHTGGLLVDMALAAGGNVLLRTEFEPGAFLRDIAHYRITDTLIGVPLLYELLSHPDVHTSDVSSLRRLLYIGCPASPERIKDAVQIFPGVLNHSYGTTETGQIAMLTASDHDDPSLLTTVGRPRADLDVAVRDPDTGVDLPVGEIGEVVVRGENNLEGYVGDPALTRAVLRQGWVHTGDLGCLDERGYLRLSGRRSEMVKVHDTRVHPSEVEKVLVGHPGVVDACVYARRRPDLTEELRAAVVLRIENPPSFEALRRHVADRMTPTHAPARFVRWREFPVNTNGKVDRLLVRERSTRPDVVNGVVDRVTDGFSGSVTANYESLIRKIRGSATGAGRSIRFFCLLCGQEFRDPSFNRCTTCHGALDAFYDLDQVTVPEARATPNPLQHYFDLLPVHEQESLHWVGEGNTPCFEVPRLAADLGIGRLYFKNESVNPTYSTKDRVASVCLSRFDELGVRDIVVSSTGNTSTAYARAVQLIPGFRLHVFVGRDFVHRLNYAEHPSVSTHVVDGDFVAAGRIGEEFARDNGFFWEGGFFNLSRREGLKVSYLEAYDEMPTEPDAVFQAVSSGMGLLGAYKGALEYRELGRLSRVPAFTAVQQASCAPMAHAFGEGASAIAAHHIVQEPRGLAYAILRGNPTGTYPYIRDLCLNSGGQILAVSDERIRHAQKVLAETVGVRICFASSTALAGAVLAAETGQVNEDSVVLVNLTGADRPVAQVPTTMTTWTA